VAGIDAHGVIPGIANLVPRSVAAAWEAGARGDAAAALRHHGEVLAATRTTQLGRGGGTHAANFSGLKAALKLLGIIEHDTVSAPLRPLSDEEQSQLPPLLKELGLR
jgi:4-hydroxy-tetrahydrodipicolinate synthase